ncbi:MAG: aminoacyl--tRNA ligase-related protein [bacterium]|nr:aminoacyl--tRNA ligase-related protein [bacterium]
MRQSRFFTKVQRDFPKDEVSLNAKLLMRAGFIHKVMAGVYEYLPLGLRVLNRINSIIREEINRTGAEELFMSVLQNKETWTATGRWNSAKDVMYQFEDTSGKEVGLGWTHEEPLTALAVHYINSYKDLPKAVYQIQTKFRNEPRAKSGLIRGREFFMKDLYSFHATEEDLDRYYEEVAVAYKNIFERCGLKAKRTLASGGLFSKFSDEYQVLSDAGEDLIYHCEKCDYAANKEVGEELKASEKCPSCGGKIIEGKSIEVGNIFKLGTKFSDAFDLKYLDKDGEKKPVIMASYGIGPGRVLGAIVEVSHDDKGIIWPEAVAPFRVHLIELPGGDGKKLYEDLQKKGIEVLYDERELRAGEKLVEADLLGIPWRAVVSGKTAGKVEVKARHEAEAKLMTEEEFLSLLAK